MKRPRRKPFADCSALTETERVEFTALLDSAVFRKALARVHSMKPSVFSTVPTPQDKADRLCQIQGWELFEHALYLQAKTPKPRAKTTTETYPNEGLIDHEP